MGPLYIPIIPLDIPIIRYTNMGSWGKRCANSLAYPPREHRAFFRQGFTVAARASRTPPATGDRSVPTCGSSCTRRSRARTANIVHRSRTRWRCASRRWCPRRCGVGSGIPPWSSRRPLDPVRMVGCEVGPEAMVRQAGGGRPATLARSPAHQGAVPAGADRHDPCPTPRIHPIEPGTTVTLGFPHLSPPPVGPWPPRFRREDFRPATGPGPTERGVAARCIRSAASSAGSRWSMDRGAPG
jgi:hypothetical protein